MDKSKTNAIVEGFWQYLKKENKLDLLPDVLHALSKKEVLDLSVQNKLDYLIKSI